ncbi:helix-turn-helix transcriptional regulator [Streptomyces sp. 11-1-2]|uniref:helix-turn-helix domain-containing protein n=1 Tax=unclassified Streptomyces TaxID=2593676 RepID=UPI000B8D2767|nr:helix-turn-helix transcriptional regulator [Streptomyces sp. 11-1-2]ASQ95436.1 transcriptional regulator [Streptomyces sp. 11-1-2]
MPPSSTPTARKQRLGAELRKLRERAGMSSTAAAALLGGNQARISNIEAGRYAVSADRVRVLAQNYSCSDQALVDALAGMTGDRKRGWWEEYRETFSSGLLDLAELEHHAVAARVAQVITVPGLLQTPEHARAIFRDVVPPLMPPEVEHRVSYRVKRQVVLFRDEPLPYTAIIHEAALRMQFGGAATAKAQLEHLIGMSERDHVTVVVIPFGGVSFPISAHGVDYFCGPVTQLDTVQLDTAHGVELVDAAAQLEKYRLVLDRMEQAALGPDESRDLIRRIAREI